LGAIAPAKRHEARPCASIGKERLQAQRLRRAGHVHGCELDVDVCPRRQCRTPSKPRVAPPSRTAFPLRATWPASHRTKWSASPLTNVPLRAKVGSSTPDASIPCPSLSLSLSPSLCAPACDLRRNVCLRTSKGGQSTSPCRLLLDASKTVWDRCS